MPHIRAIGQRQVHFAVAVKIRGGDIGRIHIRNRCDRGLKGAIAVAEQDRESISCMRTMLNRDRQVEFAVVVQVSRNQPIGFLSAHVAHVVVNGRSKAAIAVADEDGYFSIESACPDRRSRSPGPGYRLN